MPDSDGPDRAGPVPQHCPSPRELDDLEVLLSGALARRAFDEQVRLDLPRELAERVAAGGAVDLVDPEGLPLARHAATGLEPLASPSYGPFRRLHLTPEETRERYAGRPLVPVVRPLGAADLEAVAGAGRPVVLLALAGTGTPEGVDPVGLVRATRAAARLLGQRGVQADLVTVPLAAHDDPALDASLREEVLAAYASGEVLRLPPAADADLPPEVAAVVEQSTAGERGVVVLLTGLSGSGKSTLARALLDLVLEEGRRTVTSLDGDVVRRHLSAGLGFSRADRETNILPIGWVPAEIARHGGVALCSPIAPFDATRQQVRAMVEQAGGRLVLVHVATPLEECERRDRKGLYAKARAGEIPDFTGISSPYEEPADADVVIDTTGRSIEDCVADLVATLPDEVVGGR